MKTDGNAQAGRRLHGLSQKLTVQYRNAVICKPGCSKGMKSFHICQFLSLHPFCYTSTAFHMNSGLFPFFQHFRQYLRRVYYRLCICHTDYCRKTSSGCCTGPCLNILFIGQSRIPKMNMYIHQSRRRHQAGPFQNLAAVLF